jgi:hypothetical protein
VEEESPCGRTRVNRVGETYKVDAFLFELAHEIDELFHASSEAVKFPHNETVTISKFVERPLKTRTVGNFSAQSVIEDNVTSRLCQRFSLNVEVLVLG